MKKTTVYMHRSKDVNSDLHTELELPESVWPMMRFALSEVAVDIEVNEETGEVTPIAFYYDNKMYKEKP